MRYVLYILLLVGWGLLARPVQAQQTLPDLLVQLHDVHGAPVVGAAVSIRDQGGSRELARAVTDAQGQARITGLTVDTIRVVVQGSLPGGMALYQPGNDAQGILIYLVGGTLQLDLRTEVDGMVVLDPATMTGNELGVPLGETFPTAPLAVPPTVPVAPHAALPTVEASGLPEPLAQETPPAPGSSWPGLVILVVLVGVGLAVSVLQRRWRVA